MLTLEVRAFNALREKIQEDMAQYINELDNIDLRHPNALVLFAETRMHYSTLEDVLFMMEEVQGKLSE